VLAVLLINANEVVSVDKIVDDLWGEEPPDTALNTVQVYVSQVRRLLSPRLSEEAHPILETRRPGYLLHVEPEQLDLDRFDRLAREGRDALSDGDASTASVKLHTSLALWRGGPLADFTFEPFAHAEIERLEEMRLTTVEDRIEADLELGRHRELVGELESLAKAHPVRERLQAHRMLALYRSGRQAEALQAYHDTANVLREDLGIDPGASLQRLYEDMLRQEPSLQAPQPERAEPTATRVTAAAAIPAMSPSPPATVVDQSQMLTLTALFADIVGSTSLAERLSPEEVRAIIGECVNRMSRVVEEFGGMVQAYMGDGIAAYFGLPEAHEDDTARACRAGLRLLQVARDYAGEVETAWGISDFSIRVGINAGRTATAEVGSAAPQGVAFGDPLNVAARLQSIAEPGTVVVGEAVVRRLPVGFAFDPLGEFQVKGREAAVSAWRLVGLQTGERAGPTTPLVGRESETARLAELGRELEAGRGQILIVEGEAGLGKTRLLHELMSAMSEQVIWLEGRCQPFGAQEPYAPFVEILRRWLGVGEGDADLLVRTKLRSRLLPLLGPDADQAMPLLARLLSVRGDPSVEDAISALAPEQLASGIADAFRSWVEAICSHQPTVVALEDLQDADRATCALAESLLPLTDSAALMLALATRRDAETEGWRLRMQIVGDYGHRASQIALSPLSREASGELVDALSPTGAIDPASREDIVSRAEGNPLYVEEFMRALLETGGLERSRSWTMSVTSMGRMLPPALEGLLTFRVQRLPEGGLRLAQIAAVIGREFSVPILERVAGEELTREHLPTLLRAEVVRETRRFPELWCSFHHGLLRDAALSTLLPSRMRELYRNVAEQVEAAAPDPEDLLDRLAFYYYRSDAPERAIMYLERAATRAASMHASDEALELWNRVARIAARTGDREAEERAAARIIETTAAARDRD
jgi:class 3 adenylate cyclase/DNA-binding winged helix-turn-helix (wHTH) protein